MSNKENAISFAIWVERDSPYFYRDGLYHHALTDDKLTPENLYEIYEALNKETETAKN
jgi:hypothetical protein